jgi:hypothetical protein
MTDEAPIATYRERLVQVRREFSLHADRVVVRARWLSGRTYRNTIPLDRLDPTPTQARIRQRAFRRALPIALLAAAAAVVFSRPGYQAVQPWLNYGLYGLFILFGAVTAIAWPRVLFIRFNSRQNGQPGLDIARAGPDSRHFEAFVEQVRNQIRRNRRS